MKSQVRFALFVAVALYAAPLFAQAPAAPAADPLSKIPELALSDGRVLKDATIGGFGAETVVVRHKGGSAVLRYEFLPDEQRAAAEKKRPGGARSFTRQAGSEAAAAAGGSQTVAGQVFITTRGAGAYKFSGVTVHAFPSNAAGAWQATNANPVPMPKPLATATTDADGKFAMRVPKGASFLLWAQAKRLLRDGRTEEFEWRIPSAEIAAPESVAFADKWLATPRPIRID